MESLKQLYEPTVQSSCQGTTRCLAVWNFMVDVLEVLTGMQLESEGPQSQITSATTVHHPKLGGYSG